MLQPQNQTGAAQERQRDIIDAVKTLELVISDLENRTKLLREQFNVVLKPDLPTAEVSSPPKSPQPLWSPMAEGLRTGVRRLEDVLALVNDMLHRNQL